MIARKEMIAEMDGFTAGHCGGTGITYILLKAETNVLSAITIMTVEWGVTYR